MSAQRLAGAVAVVTGSSTGNGRAIALELAAEGAKVVCSDIRKTTDPSALEQRPEVDTDDLIDERGGDARYHRADVTRAEQVDALADVAVAEFGRIDVWVNNAGIAIYGPLEVETFERGFARCSGCKVVAEVPLAPADIGPALQQMVQSALLKHADANTVISGFDVLLLAGVESGGRASGLGSKIKLFGASGGWQTTVGYQTAYKKVWGAG